jgi:tetratricopeptide (TPR) repeat protein
VARASAEGATEEDELLAATHFARRGEIEKALDYFGRALARNATLTEAHTGRAELLARQLKFDEAIAALDAALAQTDLEPAQRLEIGKQKGHYLVRTGNAEGALKVWSELLVAHPDDLLLHEDVVEAFASEGMLEEAIAAARALAEKTSDPHDRILREFRIAELHLQSGKEDLATGIYEQVLPQSGAESWLEREILGRVSAIYRRKDDLAGLRSWVEAQAKAHPHRLTLLKQRAALSAENGDAEGAMAGTAKCS